MTDQVEKLTKELNAKYPTHWTEDSTHQIARDIIGLGYIPKESVLELVERCSECRGTGNIAPLINPMIMTNIDCAICSGRGIVLRGEK